VLFLHTRGGAGPSRLAPIHPFPQHRHLCRGQCHFAFRGLRPREMTALQNLVVEAEPLAVPVQNLQPVAHPAAKDKDRPTGRILLKQPFRPRTKTCNAAAHVGDARCDEHPPPVPRADHALSRTRISCAKPDAESPSIPRNRRPFASTISTRVGAGAAATTAAISTGRKTASSVSGAPAPWFRLDLISGMPSCN
jgi:hypothetical protein